MFGDKVDDVPIVQVSIERSGDPEQNWAVGKALSKLRFVSGFSLYSNLLVRADISDVLSFIGKREFSSWQAV